MKISLNMSLTVSPKDECLISAASNTEKSSENTTRAIAIRGIYFPKSFLFDSILFLSRRSAPEAITKQGTAHIIAFLMESIAL